MDRRDERAYPLGSVSEEQQRQMAPFRTTLRAAVPLPRGFVARRSQIAADMLPPRFAPCASIYDAVYIHD